MSKKTLAIAGLTLLLSASSVSAEMATSPANRRQEIREQLKDKIMEVKDELKTTFAAFKNSRINLKEAKLLSKTNTTLTVEKDNITYIINITDKTQLRRRFGAKSSLSEMAVNDVLDIRGRWADDSKSSINALLVRDISIQKRFGVFFGTLKTLNGFLFSIDTVERGTQTVTFDAHTKLINRKQQTISTSDLQVGQRVRIRGLWDNTNHTISQVTEIKDFSLPIVNTTDSLESESPEPTHTPKPTTTPMPTTTPTPSPSSTPSPTP